MQTGRKIRLLIVDDSAVFRGVLSRGLSADPSIEVVATAGDPFEARDKIVEFEPDVMVCDVVMPKMDGIEFIRRLLPQYPLRVVVISSASEAVLDAMNAGAVDFVSKPDLTAGRTPAMFISELTETVKVAAKANLSLITRSRATDRTVTAATAAATRNVIAVGASTGGTEAIYNVLRYLPPTTPGILIVQHIPPVFSQMFAKRLNDNTQLTVKEAQSGDLLGPGIVLVAPGDRHMRIKRVGGLFRAEVFEGPKRNGHCPSVDVLFESVAEVCGQTAVGVILTGMGEDGARGLLAMRKSGARTIGQDEKSCVVYGMPKAAYEMGGVERQSSLEDIPNAISSVLSS